MIQINNWGIQMEKVKNYIDNKGNYINIENKSLREIWLDGYECGRLDKEKVEGLDKARHYLEDDGK